MICGADFTNDGTLRVTGGGSIVCGGVFTNNGTLDLLTSAGALPAGFVNNGSVILNTERRILTTVRSGTTFTCTVQGYAGHTYQLQHADSLAGTWVAAGAAQAGAGARLTFIHTGSAARGFYRVAVTP